MNREAILEICCVKEISETEREFARLFGQLVATEPTEQVDLGREQQLMRKYVYKPSLSELMRKYVDKPSLSELIKEESEQLKLWQ